MTVLFVVLAAVVWLAMGYLGERVSVVYFEAVYGTGSSMGTELLFVLLGPITLAVAGVCSLDMFTKADWQAALCLREVDKRPVGGCYFIDKPKRSLGSRLLLIGVKGLPDYDENTEDYVKVFPILEDQIRFERLTSRF